MKRLFYLLAAVTMWVGCNNGDSPADPAQTEPVNGIAEPAAIAYQVVAEYPHDTAAYTQGLIWHNNQLIEGTGQFKESNLRRVDLATGKVQQQVKNGDEIFGEGITLLNGKIYQITWQNKLAYVYDAASLKKEKEFPLNTDGWGLTHNGKELILSDGSSNLYFLDPLSFREIRRIGVFDHLGPKANINELEFINGFVYANQYQTDYILKIDPASGRVVGRADLGDLRGKAGIPAYGSGANGPDVLNGIAYDSAQNRIFITGKYWPKLFEVKLDN